MSERQDTLTKVLAYVDSPFKLFALILMALLAFFGYMLHDNRDIIIGTYREHQKLPQIAEGRIDDAATHLFKYTGAQVVAVFKVNPITKIGYTTVFKRDCTSLFRREKDLMIVQNTQTATNTAAPPTDVFDRE